MDFDTLHLENPEEVPCPATVIPSTQRPSDHGIAGKTYRPLTRYLPTDSRDAFIGPMHPAVSVSTSRVPPFQRLKGGTLIMG